MGTHYEKNIGKWLKSLKKGAIHRAGQTYEDFVKENYLLFSDCFQFAVSETRKKYDKSLNWKED